jgi:hypothetical protein
MPICIVSGCSRNAVHSLGVRLRYQPGPKADWAPETNAHLCDVRARSGAKITIVYEATSTGRIETSVYPVEAPVVRRTKIR